MPPSLGTLGLTPSQKIIYQRERNKLKQRDLRARRAAEKRAAKGGVADVSSTSSQACSSSSRPLRLEGGEDVGSSTGKQRGRKFMLQARRALDEAAGVEGRGEGEEGERQEREMGLMVEEEGTERMGSSSVPALASPRIPSTSTTSKRKLSSVSLFATLLNGGSLPPPPTLASPSALSSSSNLLLRQPFPSSSSSSSISRRHPSSQPQQSSWPTPPPDGQSSQLESAGGRLPSYTFLSPVNIGRSPFYNPLNAIDWKVRLFQIHAVLHQDRDDPVKGYLHSSVAEQTITTTQTLILNLLAATSPPGLKQMLDSERILSAEDEEYLRVTPMDPRIEWMPDPVVRMTATKAISLGLVNLTDRFAKGIEFSTLFGDPMDSGAWKYHDNALSPVDPSIVYTAAQAAIINCEPRPEHYGLNLRGATIREIVLGLELPGWRTQELIRPPSTWFEDESDQFLRRVFDALGPPSIS